MASIDLSNIFFQLRNNYTNSSSNPTYYDDEYSNDQAALIDKNTGGIAGEISGKTNSHHASLDLSHMNMPSAKPNWTTGTESIKRKLKENKELLIELKAVQEKILSKPLSFDDHQEENLLSNEENSNNKIRTAKKDAFTQNLHFMEKKLKSFNKWRRQNKGKISGREYIIMENMSSTLAERIQSTTSEFSKQTNQFSERLDQKNSENSTHQPSQQNFSLMEEINLSDRLEASSGNAAGGSSSTTHNNHAPTLLDVRINNEIQRKIDSRENAITNVTKDIYELNKLFKEVATMVVEQGSVMDRIDYNIEQTAEKVEAGHEELEKARSYQKKNKKLNIIMCEAITVIFLFIIFVWRHSG